MSALTNKELLRLCDEVERESFTDHEAVYWFTRATKLAYFLKSRLQAEAPTDAEVAAIEKRHADCEGFYANHGGYRPDWHKDRATLLAKLRSTSQAEAPEDARKDEIEIAKHILGLIFPKANDADFAMFVERHGVHIAAIIRADRNAARTSQAEAQAPTTAALTEAVYAWVREDLSFGAKMRIGFFVQKLIERLTVGAPAPATTHARQCGYWLDLNCSCKLEGDTP